MPAKLKEIIRNNNAKHLINNGFHQIVYNIEIFLKTAVTPLCLFRSNYNERVPDLFAEDLILLRSRLQFCAGQNK